ncbi:hypothetical protein ILUMI_21796 [Ignelater luminosus]|uniref:Uncharacterized protein n=1 Tax=Ignelater luminosus TaxID=2038154 RepID=A0A8K0CI03_IGNLU|nr:hypothetical protein ILUMI_21796 [Ignelater luminosus]
MPDLSSLSFLSSDKEEEHRRIRMIRHRNNPMNELDDFEFKMRFGFSEETLMEVLHLLANEIKSQTKAKRNQLVKVTDRGQRKPRSSRSGNSVDCRAPPVVNQQNSCKIHNTRPNRIVIWNVRTLFEAGRLYNASQEICRLKLNVKVGWLGSENPLLQMKQKTNDTTYEPTKEHCDRHKGKTKNMEKYIEELFEDERQIYCCKNLQEEILKKALEKEEIGIEIKGKPINNIDMPIILHSSGDFGGFTTHSEQGPYAIASWYETLKKLLKEEKISHLVWNCNESGFCHDPKDVKLIAPKDLKRVSRNVRSSGCPCLTNWIPEDDYPGTACTAQNKGWMDRNIFYQ